MDNFTDIKVKSMQEKIKQLFSGPKIIFAILGIVILIEVVYAVRFLTQAVPVAPSPVPQATTIQKSEGKISLTMPLKTSIAINEMVPVDIIIDSGGYNLDGVDVIVRFDPKFLEATPEGLVNGIIFDEYPLSSVDGKQGLVFISGISSLGNSFNGQGGKFASIKFKAKAKGTTSLTVDFQKGLTTDSNLVAKDTTKDILGKVDNLELAIQ